MKTPWETYWELFQTATFRLKYEFQKCLENTGETVRIVIHKSASGSFTALPVIHPHPPFENPFLTILMRALLQPQTIHHIAFQSQAPMQPSWFLTTCHTKTGKLHLIK